MKGILPSQERLWQVLDYNPETGIFVWKRRTDVRGGWNAKCAGKIAGRLDSDGHRQISVDGRRHHAARLAWVMMAGIEPVGEIDHRDTIRDNNAFVNLREGSHAQNMRNRGAQANSASGIKGVWRHTYNDSWIAQIKINGQPTYLGSFHTKEEAAAAYAKAAAEHHGEFARVA
jgi:hypothetical protein